MHNLLRTLEPEKKKSWPNYLNELTFAYNVTPHSSTGFTPFFLLFGQNPRLFMDNLINFGSISDECKDEWVLDHRRKMSWATMHAFEQLSKKASERKARHDIRASEHDIPVGSKVLIRNRVKGRNKIQDTWSPIPFVVKNRIDKNVYRVESIDGSGEIRTVNKVDLLLIADTLDSDDESVVSYKSAVDVEDDVDSKTSSSSDSDDDRYVIPAGHRRLAQPEAPRPCPVERRQMRDRPIEPEPVVTDTQPSGADGRRYPRRANAGTHSNPHNLPKSVLKSSAHAERDDLARAIGLLGEKLSQSLGTILKDSYR